MDRCEPTITWEAGVKCIGSLDGDGVGAGVGVAREDVTCQI